MILKMPTGGNQTSLVGPHHYILLGNSMCELFSSPTSIAGSLGAHIPSLLQTLLGRLVDEEVAVQSAALDALDKAQPPQQPQSSQLTSPVQAIATIPKEKLSGHVAAVRRGAFRLLQSVSLRRSSCPC